MGVSPSGQFRVIEETKPKRRAVSGEGLRWDLAGAALSVAGIILLALSLFTKLSPVILVIVCALIGITARAISRAKKMQGGEGKS